MVKLFLIFSLFGLLFAYNKDVGRLLSQHRVSRQNKQEQQNNNGGGHEWYFCDRKVNICTEDLRGYKTACYSNSNKKQKEQFFRACANGTRCGCDTNQPCPLTDPCVKIIKPNPIVTKGTFRFSGVEIWKYNKNGGSSKQKNDRDRTYDIKGVVKQDTRKKKFIQLISHEGHAINNFEIIVPNRYGNFSKYTGFQDGHCQAILLEKFEPLGYDIENYNLVNTNEIKMGKYERHEQVWAYKVRHNDINNQGVTLNWQWQMLVEPTKNNSVPIHTYFSTDGARDDDKVRYRKEQTVEWRTSHLGSLWTHDDKWYTNLFKKKKGGWFRVPEFCKNVGYDN